MNTYTNTYRLYHHGIKGMKWGIRRFQQKDGTLTSAGKKRYNDTPNTPTKTKSKYRLKLEEKYRNQGLTKEQAELAASKRIKTEKILTAAAGITVASATAYVIRKNVKRNADSIIKSGQTLNRIERYNSDGKLHDQFYASMGKSDKIKYAGRLGANGESYMMKIGVTKDIKVAGNTEARKHFENLYNSDEQFRRRINTALGKTNAHGENFTRNNIKKLYENFNSNLIERDDPAVQKFYRTLSENGYGAVRDINDMKFSGLKAKNPLIIFQRNNVAVQTITQLQQDKAASYLLKDGRREAGRLLTQLTAVGVPVSALSTFASSNTSRIDNIDERMIEKIKSNGYKK